MKNKHYIFKKNETTKLNEKLKKTLENLKNNNNNQITIKVKPKSQQKNIYKLEKKNKDENIQKIFTQGQFELKTFEESKIQFEKLKLRSKFIKLYSKVLIKDPEEFLTYNFLFKKNLWKLVRKKTTKKRKDDKLIITPHSNFFSDIQTTFRYEDIYNTPREFIQKNFSREEKNFMVLDPKYFFLNKPPFSNANLPLKYTLKEKINEEDEILNKKIKIKKQYLINKNKNRTLHLSRNINNENKKFKLNSESFENNTSNIPLTNRTAYNSTLESLNIINNNNMSNTNIKKKERKINSDNLNNLKLLHKSRNTLKLKRPNTAISYNFNNNNNDYYYKYVNYNTEDNQYNNNSEYLERKKVFLYEKNIESNLKNDFYLKKKEENIKNLQKKEENKKKIAKIINVLQTNYLSNKY